MLKLLWILHTDINAILSGSRGLLRLLSGSAHGLGAAQCSSQAILDMKFGSDTAWVPGWSSSPPTLVARQAAVIHNLWSA